MGRKIVAETDTMVPGLPIAGNLTYREWHGFVDGFFNRTLFITALPTIVCNNV